MIKKTILLVEDNPDDEILALRALRKANVMNEVVVARDGIEALDFFHGKGKFADRDLNKMPTITLLDIKLPKMNGLEVLKKIREHKSTRYVPVVMLTLSKEEEDIRMSYHNGANSYVCKPIDYDKFSKVAEEIGIYWMGINQEPPLEEKSQ
jgi:CheY-like chemotaxis protein